MPFATPLISLIASPRALNLLKFSATPPPFFALVL